ncbi:MAG: hypothetical protein ACLFUJ_15590 [Phycisphaerae bacterium]
MAADKDDPADSKETSPSDPEAENSGEDDNPESSGIARNNHRQGESVGA